ncbi:MAG: rhomboid family intramembrane serine protease [Gammaproteobacteria bacterium]|jgi:membrane associated rhomboid family serine protease
MIQPGSQGLMIAPVVKLLLIVNIGMFLLELVYAEPLIRNLALWPLDLSGMAVAMPGQPTFSFHQLLTYGFLHGGFLHLFLNMYALWLFGTRLEMYWGSRDFAVYYLVCVFGAALVQLVVSSVSGEYYPTIGASGGVFGLLLAFGMTFPREVLILIFPPIPIQARWFVMIYAAIELWAGVTGTASGIAHFAHLGGMLFGAILLLLWRRR